MKLRRLLSFVTFGLKYYWLSTVASPACGLLSREKSGSASPLTRRVQQSKGRREQKEKMVRRAPQDVSTSLGATQVSARLVPAQDSFGLSARPIDAASQILRFRTITM